MRKKLCLGIITALFCLSSCAKNKQIYEHLRVSYKPDSEVNTGLFSARYEDRIYYYSDGPDTSGIYSMDIFGNDIHQEVQCGDIAGIQVTEDAIFYLEECGKNTYGARKFDLVRFDKGEKTQIDVMDPELYDRYRENFLGTANFYVDDNRIFLNVLEYEKKRELSSRALYLQTEQLQYLYDEMVEVAYDNIEGNQIYIFNIGSHYIATSYAAPGFRDPSKFMIPNRGIQDCFGYNEESGTMWWTHDDSANKWDPVFKIWDKEADSLYMTVSDFILEYDIQKNTCIWKITLPPIGGETVSLNRCDGIIYGIQEIDSSSIYQKRNKRCRHKIFKIDPDSQEILYEKEFNYKEVVLFYNAQRLMYYEPKQGLHLIEFTSEGSIHNEVIIPFEMNLYEDGFQVDIAGPWLFIKYYDPESGQAELKLKVNVDDIGSNECGYLANEKYW